jgi:hypothetical protein
MVTASQDTDAEWAAKKVADAAAAAAAAPTDGAVAEPGEAGFNQKTWEAAIEAKYSKK